MDLWRTITWVIALTLPQLSLSAAAFQDGRAFCQARQMAGEPACHLQPCPCGPDEATLQRFEDASGAPPLCACRSPLVMRRHTRRQAADACDSFRRTQRQSCFISSGDCPRGFEAIADFSDEDGNRFSACRDSRHEQPRHPAADPPELSRQQLRDRYERLIDRLDTLSIGAPQSLPQATVDDLKPYFNTLSLNELPLIRTQALSQGCFNDCERIFCAADMPMTPWLNADQPLISRQLLHLLAHAESCRRVGGRDRFVDHWFRHLPDDVYQRLRSGEPIDAGRLHYSMYMENSASHRAENLCRQLSGCRLE